MSTGYIWPNLFIGLFDFKIFNDVNAYLYLNLSIDISNSSTLTTNHIIIIITDHFTPGEKTTLLSASNVSEAWFIRAVINQERQEHFTKFLRTNEVTKKMGWKSIRVIRTETRVRRWIESIQDSAAEVLEIFILSLRTAFLKRHKAWIQSVLEIFGALTSSPTGCCRDEEDHH